MRILLRFSFQGTLKVFEDLDAHFNRASTPKDAQKPAKNQQPTGHSRDNGQPPRHPLKPPQAAAKRDLVAKPLKMISSKIAEHYRKEPRLEVSMSEAETEMRQRELEAELEREGSMSVNVKLKGKENVNYNVNKITTWTRITTTTATNMPIHRGDEKFQRAKRGIGGNIN